MGGTNTENDRKSVCIIGAGITGLTTAYRLVQAGFDVTVLEQDPEPGGMLASFCFKKSRLEYLYHHVFTSDTHLLSLADEMGLLQEIQWHTPHNALYGNGQLYPFGGPLDLLRLPLIPLIDRIRTGWAVLRAGDIRDFRKLESQTAADWLRRHSGKRAYEVVWKPLLRSKFDTDAETVSAVWIWNKFKLRGGSRSGSVGKEQLGYMRGSFAQLTDRLAEAILAGGGQILTRYTALNLSKRDEGGYAVTSILEDCSARTLTFDAVVACIAGRQFYNIAGALRLPHSYMEQLTGVPYKANICLTLRLSHPVSSYYWTTVCDALPFVVAVEHTQLTGTEPYEGAILYLSRYLSTTNPMWTWNDDEVYRDFIYGLSKVFPSFNPHEILEWRIKRTRYAQPVMLTGKSDAADCMHSPEPGVKLAGLEQIYPEDRGMNYAVRLADKVAAAVEDYLAQR